MMAFLPDRVRVSFAVMIALLVAPVISTGETDDRVAGDVYDLYRQEILKSGFLEVSGWVFAFGAFDRHAEVIDHTDQARAKLRALRRILPANLKVDDVPSSIPTKLWEGLREKYTKHCGWSAHLDSVSIVEVVNSNKGGVVVAVPAHLIVSRSITFSKLVEELIFDPCAVEDKECTTLLLEIPQVTLSRIGGSSIEKTLLGRLGQAVIDLVAGTCRQVQIKDYRSVFLLGDLPPESFQGVESLSMLDLWPYNPVATRFVTSSLESSGFSRMALRLTTGYETFVEKGSVQNTVFDLEGVLGPWFVVPDTTLSGSRFIQAVADYMGKVPICSRMANNDFFNFGSKEFYSQTPGYLQRALSLFLQGLDHSIDADGCNMAGRCLALTGRIELAALCFRQAVWLDPEHPYAGANLGLMLVELGFNDRALAVKEHVLRNPNLADWSRTQLGEISGP